jgi:hypothetical protein
MTYTKIAASLFSAFILFTSQANAHSAHIERNTPTCDAGETLVRDTFTPSTVHGFGGLGDNLVNNIMWANFSFDKNLAKNMHKLFVQVLFTKKTEYNLHNFYLVPEGPNISNIYWKLNAQGYDWTQFDLDDSPYGDYIKRTGKVTIGLSHIDPKGEFKEYVYMEKVTMGFCSRS